MGRRPCCEKEGLNRGAWSAEEDEILLSYIQTHGQGKWRDVPHSAGLMRCGKSCRLRWLNYLRPDIKRGNITIEEEDLILRLHKLLGNRWSLIAGRLPGRTDNEIKNYWNTNLSKRLVQANKVQDPSTKQLDESKVNNSGTLTDSQPVIRTKAFRCKKVVIPNCLLDNDRDHQIQMAADKNILRVTDPSSSSSGLRHINNNDNYSPEEFLNDFNIDDLLVSDILLNSDSCPPSKLQVFNDCDDLDRVIGVDDGDQNGLEQYVSCDDVVDDFPLLSGHDDDDQTVHRTMSFDENGRDVSTCYDPLQPNDQGLELSALSWFMNLDDDDHESHRNIG